MSPPRPLYRSAVWRMTLAFAGVVVVAAGLMLFLALRGVSTYTEQRIAETVATDLKGFEDVFAQSGLPGLKEAMERRLSWDARRLYMLVDGEGEILAGNTRQWPNNEGGANGTIHFRDEATGRPYDGGTRTLPSGVKILLAQDRSEHDALLAGLLRALLLPILGVLLLALGGGYWLARGVLARIEAVNITARQVEAGDLSARVPQLGQGSDEFSTLGTNVNAMLARIDRLMASVQHLSDHIAHETRTPLARLRARLEKARSAAGADETSRAAFDDAVAETETIIAVFSALLDITAAEAAAGDGRGLVPLDLSDTIADVVDLYEGVAEDKGVILTVSTEPAPILGEPMLVMRMLANVVDNAIKFSPPGSTVRMALSRFGDDAVLRVSDQGPGMAQGFAGSAFERFSRADDAKATPGHGLGLPLVRAIALRHGIRIALEDAKPGLVVVFRAPMAKSA